MPLPNQDLGDAPVGTPPTEPEKTQIRNVLGITAAISAAVNTASEDATSKANAVKSRSEHTGTQSADTLTDGATNKVYTAAEKTKLAGVATGATANATNAELRDRSTHTGALPAAVLNTALATDPAASRAAIGLGSIRKMALLGDSITNATHSTNFFGAQGWGAHMRGQLSPYVDFSENGYGYDFGISGATAVSFLAGDTSRYMVTAALGSDADTVVVYLGTNDCGFVDAPDTAAIYAAIVSLWDDIEAAGKRVISADIVAVRSTHSRAATYLAAATTINRLMAAEAALRGQIHLGWQSLLDDTGDGYSDVALTYDNTHPNTTGSCRMGLFAAEIITPYLDLRNPAQIVPLVSSGKWVTPNPFAKGVTGAGQTATGWTKSQHGNAVAAMSLELREGSAEGHWQVVEITGALDAAIFLSSPTDHVRVYQRNASVPVVAGEKYRGYVEFEIAEGSSFYLVLSTLQFGSAGTDLRSMLNPNGLLTNVSAKDKTRRGIFITEPYTIGADATADIFSNIRIYGNGTIKLGQCGVFRE